MSETRVQTWDAVDPDSGMFESEYGVWVHVDDYDDLAARVRELEEEVAERGNAMDRWLEDVHKATGGPDWEYPGQIVRDVVDLRDRISSLEEHCSKLEAAVRWMWSLKVMEFYRADIASLHPIIRRALGREG